MSAGDRRDSGSQPDDDRRPLSYALVALSSLGAATLVLVVTTVVIVTVRPAPLVGLVIGLVGVVLSITAMGVVSTRLTRRAYGPPGEQTSRRHPGPGSRP